MLGTWSQKFSCCSVIIGDAEQVLVAFYSSEMPEVRICLLQGDKAKTKTLPKDSPGAQTGCQHETQVSGTFRKWFGGQVLAVCLKGPAGLFRIALLRVVSVHLLHLGVARPRLQKEKWRTATDEKERSCTLLMRSCSNLAGGG